MWVCTHAQRRVSERPCHHGLRPEPGLSYALWYGHPGPSSDRRRSSAGPDWWPVRKADPLTWEARHLAPQPGLGSPMRVVSTCARV